MSVKIRTLSQQEVEALTVVHYGSKQFKPAKFRRVKNVAYWCKPNGGLWTSPIDSNHSWLQWCEHSGYWDYKEDNFFKLKFAPDAKIAIIDNYLDLQNMPLRKVTLGTLKQGYIDFEKLLKQGYDAIYLTEQGEQNTRYSLQLNLYGWDCESVLIMNKNKVEQIIN